MQVEADSMSRCADLQLAHQAVAPLEVRLKAHSHSLGFSLVGIATAAPVDGFERYLAWIDHGFHGQMSYLADRAEARRKPDAILAQVRSVIMVGMDDNEQIGEPVAPQPSPKYPAKVARFARGDDYHRVLWDRLEELQKWL